MFRQPDKVLGHTAQWMIKIIGQGSLMLAAQLVWLPMALTAPIIRAPERGGWRKQAGCPYARRPVLRQFVSRSMP